MKRLTLASLGAATALLAGTLVATPAWADPTTCAVTDNWTGTFTGDGAVQAALDAAVPGANYGVETLTVAGTCHGDVTVAGPGILAIVGGPGATLVGGGGSDVVTTLLNKVTLTNLTIDGAGTESGIRNVGTDLTLINITITDTDGTAISGTPPTILGPSTS